MNQALQALNHQGGCAVGTVKANIGHLFAAAGIASLIKCVLICENEIIPPQVNHENPIKELTDNDSCLQVNKTTIAFSKENFAELVLSDLAVQTAM